MYRYIKGTIEEIGDSYVVIENNDIGYLINTSRNTINFIKNNSIECKIYTHLNVREDDISLYGFVTKEELDMFHLLLYVSKIGPKVALGVLSAMIPANIKLAIVTNDVNALTKAPGIGKKTANRIILELKDKIDDNIDIAGTNVQNEIQSDSDEVIAALNTLGYSRNEVSDALSKINTDGLNTQAIIKAALKQLAKK